LYLFLIYLSADEKFDDSSGLIVFLLDPHNSGEEFRRFMYVNSTTYSARERREFRAKK
jgi:hypothetical protein